MQEHYTEIRTLLWKRVCRNLAVSSAYFSTVFKKETGKTFISYLTDYQDGTGSWSFLLTTDDKTLYDCRKSGLF
ncbi:MAG: helix-turn-helix transcriptional regulator [Blautia wexlerae]